MDEAGIQVRVPGWHPDAVPQAPCPAWWQGTQVGWWGPSRRMTYEWAECIGGVNGDLRLKWREAEAPARVLSRHLEEVP
eukprot:1161591-Pelagomonas_calceolata.AAC.9